MTQPRAEVVNPDTGEVELAPDPVRETFFVEWENGLAVLWKGNLDVSFSYESTKSGTKDRLIVLTRVMAKDSDTIYLGGVYPGMKQFKTFLLGRIRSQIHHPGGLSSIPDFLASLGVDLAALPESIPAAQPAQPAKPPRRRGPDVLAILNDALAVQEHGELITFKAKRLGEVELLLKKSVVSKDYDLFLIGEQQPDGEVVCVSIGDITGKISARGKTWQGRTFVRDVLGYPIM